MGADLTPVAPAPGTLAALFAQASRPPLGRDELAFYTARLPREAGNVLEIACGAGRLLVPLATSGYAIHGIETAVPLVERCRESLAAAGTDATLVRQDLDALNLPFRYAAAFAAAGAFQRLTDADAVRAALERIRAHLLPRGVLLLDLYVPAPGAERLAAPLIEVRSVPLGDGSRIALRSETVVDAATRRVRMHGRYVHRRGNARLAEETHAGVIGWQEPEEMMALLDAAGFGDVALGPSAGCPPPMLEGGDGYSLLARL